MHVFRVQAQIHPRKRVLQWGCPPRLGGPPYGGGAGIVRGPGIVGGVRALWGSGYCWRGPRIMTLCCPHGDLHKATSLVKGTTHNKRIPHPQSLGIQCQHGGKPVNRWGAPPRPLLGHFGQVLGHFGWFLFLSVPMVAPVRPSWSEGPHGRTRGSERALPMVGPPLPERVPPTAGRYGCTPRMVVPPYGY